MNLMNPMSVTTWCATFCCVASSLRAADPLPSWNDTAPKQAIIAFVEKTTKEGTPGFVPIPERIAVFDNDGTLWSEQPMYFQAFYVFDRIKQMAAQHPEWKDKEPFASVLKGDMKTALAGGGIDFMRPWAERVYGIPPEQVVGSSIKAKYEVRDGKPVIIKLPEINHIDDKAGKPVGIHHHIGRRPLFAAGNSDGDFEMLEWTTSGKGPRFALLIHHTDAEREWSYDRESHIGKLDKGLDEGPKRGWTIASMKNDWITIFP